MTRKPLDVLVVADTSGILDDHPNPSKDPNEPTLVDPRSVLLVAGRGTGASDPETGEIVLSSRPGDLVVLREANLGQEAEHTFLLYRWRGLQEEDNLASPIGVSDTGSMLLPNNADLLSERAPTFTRAELGMFSWVSFVTAMGSRSYSLSFQILTGTEGRTDPVVEGYFCWRPAITVRLA